MGNIKVKCVFCGCIQNVPQTYEGKHIKCLSCKKTIDAKIYERPQPAPVLEFETREVKIIIKNPISTGVYLGIGFILAPVVLALFIFLILLLTGTFFM